ncbi:hypothetical protein I307_00895 [Cryptococcus deuterogattii 99/473]|uniref:Uncharacterized protein n=1 Tax=Cryptococcus deuterogattii Ram5 TaxID=1296110 RepID=A0A0D0T8S3_9TREE|nr:hypothetical protein I313_01641 [Cryptococcus deuterogattii Ram5]KIY59821.1 hypothetical protein I307_00895 [Cryptococcus deuterogattii 99/473]
MLKHKHRLRLRLKHKHKHKLRLKHRRRCKPKPKHKQHSAITFLSINRPPHRLSSSISTLPFTVRVQVRAAAIPKCRNSSSRKGFGYAI